MVPISDTLSIPESELTWTFVRSGGPGGQNVNKVASKAVLRWNLAANQNLPEEVRVRLREQQRGRLTQDGDLIFTSQRYRDQGRNIEDCLAKVRDAVLQATRAPKVRKRTRPTRGSQKRRLEQKQRRTAIKRARRAPGFE
ncbi:MAG TPA: alternative ribosome rescue aminoacyl-tRNA hydrolase ArfB [Gemmataceae bacterium]|nr:alternative ribosome rescue aminoacyl-tRNA hydrolase ArfB [Gemmataceae bacterium]